MPGMNEGDLKAAVVETQLKDSATLAAAPGQKFNQPAKFQSGAYLSEAALDKTIKDLAESREAAEKPAPAWPTRDERAVALLIGEWFIEVSLTLPPLAECHPLEHVRKNLPALVKALIR